MRETLQLLFVFVLTTFSLVSGNAQSETLTRTIMVTDTVADEDDESIMFPASSDDAEQENDEIDALYDDDLDAGWEGAAEDQNILTTGLRFRDITIPQGAEIDSAYLVLTSHEGKSAEDVARLTIYGEASANAETFTEDALITDRPATSAQILWEVAEEWELYGSYQTPDLAPVIQEIVDQPEWVSGNALALVLAGEDQGPSDLENAREFESFENIADPEDGGDGQNHPERIPMLVIHYQIPASSSGVVDVRIMVTDTVTDEDDPEITFAASSDDAEQENDEIDALFDDDLDVGWEGAAEDQNILTTGLRFRNITIEPGSIIDSAFLVVSSHEGKSAEDVARITIFGDDTDDAVTFTEDALITDRPATDAQVLWEVAEEWEIWEFYRTPDLKEIIQEIVDRDGWQSGNSVALILAGEDQGPSDLENAREFESYENIADPEDGGDGQNHPERVPQLLIYYSGGTTSARTFSPEVNKLHLYPNPNHTDLLNLEFEHSGSSTIEIYSLLGQRIKSVSAAERKVQLLLNQLNPGTYIVRARQGKETYVQKLIVR